MWIPALLVGGLLLFASGSSPRRRTRQPGPVPVRAPTEEEAEGIVFCEQQGGIVAPMESADGETYFVCQFPNGLVAEVVEFMGGTEPACPLNMIFDPETETCVEVEPQGGPSVEEILDDPNFQLCTEHFLEAWRPYTEEGINLAPAVAANLALVFAALLEDDPTMSGEDIFLVGMTYVSPECDFVAYAPYLFRVVDALDPEVRTRVDEVLNSVDEIAAAVMGGFAGRRVGTRRAAQAHAPWVDRRGGPRRVGSYAGRRQSRAAAAARYAAHVSSAGQVTHGGATLGKGTWEKCANACKLLGAKGKGVMKCANTCAWLFGGSSGKKSKRQRLDRVRMGAAYAGTGYAGACGGRRGHCGVRRR